MQTSDSPIVILGGPGKTGRRVAERLRSRRRPVRMVSRSSTPSFDWNDPSGWEESLTGASAAYIAYQPDLAFPGATASIAALVDAAAAAGIGRLVLLSGRGEEKALAAEAVVEASGLEWAVVRSSFFNQNFSESFLVETLVTGVLAFPAGAVAEPFIDADDIADVAVASLTNQSLLGQVYEVSGPELLTFAEAVGTISAAAGRDIVYVPVTPGQFAEGLRSEGVPDELAGAYADLFATVLDGRNSHLADGVERALGRPARTFGAYADAVARTGIWN
ncbi:MAG: NAD(P)H-binding protein [Acidimicrobiales bacterium]